MVNPQPDAASIAETWPAPLANAWAEVEFYEDQRDHVHLAMFLQLLVQWLAALSLAEAAANPAHPIHHDRRVRERLEELMQRPSLGHWRQLLGLMMARAGAPVIGDLGLWYAEGGREQEIDVCISYRNRLMHPPPQGYTASDRVRLTLELRGAITQLIEGLGWLQAWTAVRIDRAAVVSRERVRGRLVCYRGNSRIPEPPTEATWSGDLVEGGIYLVDGTYTRWLRLDPFMGHHPELDHSLTVAEPVELAAHSRWPKTGTDRRPEVRELAIVSSRVKPSSGLPVVLPPSRDARWHVATGGQQVLLWMTAPVVVCVALLGLFVATRRPDAGVVGGAGSKPENPSVGPLQCPLPDPISEPPVLAPAALGHTLVARDAVWGQDHPALTAFSDAVLRAAQGDDSAFRRLYSRPIDWYCLQQQSLPGDSRLYARASHGYTLDRVALTHASSTSAVIGEFSHEGEPGTPGCRRYFRTIELRHDPVAEAWFVTAEYDYDTPAVNRLADVARWWGGPQGTLTDLQANLEWIPLTPSVDRNSLAEAKHAIRQLPAGCSMADHARWRLPTSAELEGLRRALPTDAFNSATARRSDVGADQTGYLVGAPHRIAVLDRDGLRAVGWNNPDPQQPFTVVAVRSAVDHGAATAPGSTSDEGSGDSVDSRTRAGSGE